MTPDLSAAAPAPTSALTASLRRLRQRAPRTAGFLVALCLGIALLLMALHGGSFLVKLSYSLSIGLCCTLFTDAGRLALAALHDRLRAWRGLPKADGGYGDGWRGVAPATLAAMLLGTPAGLWIGDRLTGHSSPSLLSLESTSSRFTLVISLLATLASVFVLSTMERLSAARAQAEAAQRLAAETRLQLLQSQLEPHMLFNTLANLRVLIDLDPARAQAMLDRLIAHLRATLDATRSASHPLSAEFAHLDDYLALMAVRMGPRLAVRLDLPAELAALPLPPLLLQPLVENAIKHGLEPKVEGGRIEVSAQRTGATLQLRVRDTGAGLGLGPGATATTAAATSFGLAQVRARLATLYGTRATLTLQPADDAEGGTLATVTLPLE